MAAYPSRLCGAREREMMNASGPLNHERNEGSVMISGSEKRLYKKGSTFSRLSGPPRLSSITPTSTDFAGVKFARAALAADGSASTARGLAAVLLRCITAGVAELPAVLPSPRVSSAGASQAPLAGLNSKGGSSSRAIEEGMILS